MNIVAMNVVGDSGLEYQVRLEGEQVTCTCPAFEYATPAGTPCKHIKYVTRRVTSLLTVV
jgi:uncharacterized Zn finger protein